MRRIRKWWVKGAKVVRGLSEQECSPDPFEQFARWYAEAQRSGLAYPEAMALATASADGKPSVRMVLMKGYDERGFRFFTNFESRKGSELQVNPRAALLFYWEPYERQVRIEGEIEPLSAEESSRYFCTRPYGSRIGAWASPQSRRLESRDALRAEVKAQRGRFQGRDIPLPPFWGGYRCVPQSFEFWQARASRLHDRLCFTRAESGWERFRLAP